MNPTKNGGITIAYEPYRGVMKGPEGTISTEAGSAWDQAVLLAALVNAAGGEAMLGVGTLADADASRLLDLSMSQRQALSDPFTEIDMEALIERRLGVEPMTYQNPEDNQGLEVYRAAARKVAEAMTAQIPVTASDIVASDREQTRAHMQAVAESYAFVRFRDTPADPWVDAHPAFGDAVPPAVDVTEFIDSSVPEEQLHRIGIQFEIEVTRGKETTIKPVSEEFIRPAANLAATQVQLGIAPNMPFGEGTSTFFLPYINGVLAEGGQAFDLTGGTLDPADAQGGPAIFRTVGGKFASVMDGMADAAGDEALAAPRLTGITLTITHIAPGGDRVEEVRRLTDFRDGLPADPAIEIAFDGTLEVNVGGENGVRNMKAMLDASAVKVRQAPYETAYLQGDLSGAEFVTHPAFDQPANHNWFTALSDELIMDHRLSDAMIVRTAPLVLLKRTIVDPDALTVLVDVQHNDTRTFIRDEQGRTVMSRRHNMISGIFDTFLEGEFIGLTGIPSWAVTDSLEFVETEEPLKTAAIWETSNANQKDRLLADLNRSGAIALLSGVSTRWWRIDPMTGVMLGMSELGGSETTTEITLLEGISLTLTITTFGMGVASGAAACQKAGRKSGGAFTACCLVGVTALNAGLAATGGGLSGAAAKKVKAGLDLSAAWTAGIGAVMSMYFDFATGLDSEGSQAVGNGLNNTAIDVCSAITQPQ